ncbi:hypothetical protein V7S43_007955 [Phytophthora oleae]|uniref:Uncharacterized protein n=1 Tax=Phytophthora oleae TaxID=2107226 RepID=A0ABD3FMI7_9STRA
MDKVMEVTCEKVTCVQWCMRVGLIDREKRCPLCQQPMRQAPTRKRWRCCHRTQNEDGKEVCRGLLTSSFFNNSKLLLCSLVRLLLAWCMRLPQDQAAEMAVTTEKTADMYYAYCRSTCSKELLKAEFKMAKWSR